VRLLGRIFQARNGCEVVSSEKCLVGQVASVAGAAGAAVSRRCGVGVVEEESGSGRSTAFGILWDAISINVVTSSGTGRGYCGARLLFEALNMQTASCFSGYPPRNASCPREKSYLFHLDSES
jgi:hypothetical protein